MRFMLRFGAQGLRTVASEFFFGKALQTPTTPATAKSQLQRSRLTAARHRHRPQSRAGPGRNMAKVWHVCARGSELRKVSQGMQKACEAPFVLRQWIAAHRQYFLSCSPRGPSKDPRRKLGRDFLLRYTRITHTDFLKTVHQKCPGATCP